ncbi:MAG: hypothetical protein KDA96_08365 [Planctomycetaceae bacterium]|nr:hypothetical protein [Planctomycetaceae bacterium]
MNLGIQPLLLAFGVPATFWIALQPQGFAHSAADLTALDGEWVYVEDRTEGRAPEQMGPPLSAKFSLRTEEGGVVLVFGHGSGHRDVLVALDGTVTEVAESGKTTHYRGEWKDGALTYEVGFVREADKVPDWLIRRELRVTPDGLLVRFGSSVALYRHAEDIALPTPVSATVDGLAWLSGSWVGTKGPSGTTSIEERWCPPRGGAMLAVSRTVSRGRMFMFEYLRIVERDGGLVYIAQPGGGPPTEFVLTELAHTQAVFENPRHDYPQRIVYELTSNGHLTATIGFTSGGRPQRFEFLREEPGEQMPKSAP